MVSTDECTSLELVLLLYDVNNVFRLSIADTKTRQTEKVLQKNFKSQLNINSLHSGSPSVTDPDFVFALILKSKKTHTN